MNPNLVTQLSYNFHSHLTTCTRVEQNSRPNLVTQLPYSSLLVWPRARELNKTLMNPNLVTQPSYNFHSHLTTCTRVEQNSRPNLAAQLPYNSLLVWPRARELNKTRIQIWSLNPHTIFTLIWPRAQKLNKTLVQIWLLSSRATLISFDHVHESWTKLLSKSGCSTPVQLSSRLTTCTRVEQNSHPKSGCSAPVQLSSRLATCTRVEQNSPPNLAAQLPYNSRAH